MERKPKEMSTLTATWRPKFVFFFRPSLFCVVERGRDDDLLTYLGYSCCPLSFSCFFCDVVTIPGGGGRGRGFSSCFTTVDNEARRSFQQGTHKLLMDVVTDRCCGWDWGRETRSDGGPLHIFFFTYIYRGTTAAGGLYMIWLSREHVQYNKVISRTSHIISGIRLEERVHACV